MSEMSEQGRNSEVLKKTAEFKCKDLSSGDRLTKSSRTIERRVLSDLEELFRRREADNQTGLEKEYHKEWQTIPVNLWVIAWLKHGDYVWWARIKRTENEKFVVGCGISYRELLPPTEILAWTYGPEWREELMK